MKEWLKQNFDSLYNDEKLFNKFSQTDKNSRDIVLLLSQKKCQKHEFLQNLEFYIEKKMLDKKMRRRIK